MMEFVLCESLLKKIQNGRIKFDEDERNFFIQLSDSNYFDIVYCPFCGRELMKEAGE